MTGPCAASTRRSRPRISPQTAFLLVSLSFVLLVNLVWLVLDNRPPRWDESENLRLAEVAYRRLISLDWAQLLDAGGTARPNFVPLLTAISFFAFGRDYDLAVFLQTSVSLVVTSLCLYDIGRRLLDRTAGLIAVILFNSFPGIVTWSRYYTLDLPLVAFATATVWVALVYVEERSWRRVLTPSLGLLAAAGMCVKHLYPVFVALPLAYMLVQLLREADYRPLKFVRANAALLLSLTLGIALGLTYLVVLNYAGFVDGVLRSFFISKSALAAIEYVPPTLWERLIGFDQFEWGGARWYFWLFVAGGIAGILFWRVRTIFLVLWLAGPAIFLLFILGPTAAYYFQAAMPAVALLMSVSFALSPRFASVRILRFARAGAAVALALAIGYRYLDSSLGLGTFVAAVSTAPAVLTEGRAIMSRIELPAGESVPVDGGSVTRPRARSWPIDDILNAVERSVAAQDRDDRRVFALVSNYQWFSAYAFQYRLLHFGLDRVFTFTVPIPPPPAQSAGGFLGQFDVLIFKTGEFLPYPTFPNAAEINGFYERIMADDYRALRSEQWRLVGRWPLPDGSEATAWINPRAGKLFLAEKMGRAVRSHDIPNYIVPWRGNLGGEHRAGIFMVPRPGEPASALVWKSLEVPPSASELRFGIGFAPSVCAEPAPPVRFRIAVTADGETRTVFDHVLENPPCDKARWHDFAVPLEAWRGRIVELKISTAPASGSSVNYAHAVWSDLEIR
jgi:4-amino-4-deoxy-L-arabinose transferase-like glycosyltransferase